MQMRRLFGAFCRPTRTFIFPSIRFIAAPSLRISRYLRQLVALSLALANRGFSLPPCEPAENQFSKRARSPHRLIDAPSDWNSVIEFPRAAFCRAPGGLRSISGSSCLAREHRSRASLFPVTGDRVAEILGVGPIVRSSCSARSV